MSLLIFVVVVILVACLVVWFIDSVPTPPRINLLLHLLVLAVAIVLILQKVGYVHL